MPDITNQVNYVLQVSGASEAASELGRVGDAAGNTTGQTTGLSSSFKGLTGQFALGGLAAGLATSAITAVADAAKQLVSDAIELTVVMADLADAMGYVYGDAAPALQNSLDGLSATTGYARSEIYAISRDIGQMVVPMGVASAEAADMAQNIAASSADTAAALGMELSQAAGLMEAALRGSTRSARQLGIDLSEDAVQAELFRMGITEAASDVDEATLIQARYNLAMEATARYQGAAAEEMNTLEGAQRALSTAWENTAQVLGDQMAPTLTTVLQGLETMMPVIETLLSIIITLVDSAVKPYAEAFSNAAVVMDLVRAAVEWVNVKLAELLPNLGLVGDAISWVTGLNGQMRDMVVGATAAIDAASAAAANGAPLYGPYAQAIYDTITAESGLVAQLRERIALMERLSQIMGERAGVTAEREKYGLEKDLGTIGTSGGMPETPTVSTRSLSEAQTILSSMDRTTLSLHTHLTQLADDMAPISDEFADSADRMAESAQAASEEAMLAWREEMEEMNERARQQLEGIVGGMFSTMLDNMDELDDYVLRMIEQWAIKIAAAFAVETAMNAIPGLGALGKFL